MADAAFDRLVSGRRHRSIPALYGRALRIRLWLNRGRLDQQIVSGCPCWASAALAWRARQLSDPRARRGHARNLREIVAYADRAGRRPPFSAVVTVCAAVRADREAILGLAERLEASAPVNPRGIVLVARLLTDGIDSPLFNARCTRTVTEAVWDISDALGEDDPPAVAFDVVAC
jgi:hypothetical protein